MKKVSYDDTKQSTRCRPRLGRLGLHVMSPYYISPRRTKNTWVVAPPLPYHLSMHASRAFIELLPFLHQLARSRLSCLIQTRVQPPLITSQ